MLADLAVLLASSLEPSHPLLISIKKLAPALAAGNSVVLKPSEHAPLAVLALGPLLAKAGLPPGVLSILPGLGSVTGKALVEDPRIRKVDFTGGTEVGRGIGSAVGRNLASWTAELGGKVRLQVELGACRLSLMTLSQAPILVFANTDLERAVNGVAFACFIASGQVHTRHLHPSARVALF